MGLHSGVLDGGRNNSHIMPYVDIAWKARTDAAFLEKMEQHYQSLKELEVNKGSKFSSKAGIAGELWEIYKTCNYNWGLMLPWFFPKAIAGGPMSLVNRPFGFAFYDLNVGGSTVIRGSRQISKSTNFVGRQLIHQHMIPAWGSMYVVPHSEHRNTYATKLRDMEQTFRYYQRNYNLRQNLYLKESPNGNGSKIELVNAFTSVAHLRGKTANELLYDEYQLFDVQFESDLDQVLKSTKMPLRIYAGTSTTLDSPLEYRYQRSSMASWNIRSPNGKDWIDCGDKETILKCIRPQGPTCPFTNRLLNVIDGCWVHQAKHRLDHLEVGYHIPQIVVPDYAHDYNYWSTIYRDFKEFGEAKFLQEVLGIPVAEGMRELTEGDMRNICCLGSKAELGKSLDKHPYKFIISGCDWGGSDHQIAYKSKKSYTVHVVMGILANGDFDILHMRQHSGMAYDEIAYEIAKDHKAYGATALASDWGVGMFYNNELRKYIPWEKHLVLEYLGPTAPVIAQPSHGGLANQYTVNKSEAVTQVVQAIKRKDRPRIRCYNWDESQRLLMDFVNMFRVPTDNANGRSAFRFIKNPAKPDDTLHAVSFGYILGRILLGEPLFQDNSTRDMIHRNLGVNSRAGLRGTSYMGDVISG